MSEWMDRLTNDWQDMSVFDETLHIGDWVTERSMTRLVDKRVFTEYMNTFERTLLPPLLKVCVYTTSKRVVLNVILCFVALDRGVASPAPRSEFSAFTLTLPFSEEK